MKGLASAHPNPVFDQRGRVQDDLIYLTEPRAL
jgi:hypothetical protein